MIRWNLFFEVEKVEQLALIDRLATHHDRPPIAESFRKTESRFVDINEAFFNRIGQTRSFGDVGSMSGLPESGHGWTIL
jgi:hypothetical protein